MYRFSCSRRILLLAAACLQNGINTGLLFGFAAMQPALEKIKAEEGSTADTGQAFTIGVSATMIAPLLLAGPLLDYFGPRACSCVSTLIVGAGFLLFGMSPSLPGTSMSYFLPAILLMGIGGPGCQCCLFHTANLFQNKGTVLNFIAASIGLSFMVFETLAAVSTWHGMSLQRAFVLYSCLPFACTAVSFLTMPDVPFDDVPALNYSSPTPEKLAAFHAQIANADVPERRLSTAAVGQSRAAALGSARPFAFIRRKKTTYKQLRLLDELQEPLNESASLQKGKPAFRDSKLHKQIFSVAFVELTLTFAITSCFANVFLGNMQAEAVSSLLADADSDAVDASPLAASYVSMYFRLAPLGGMFNPLLGMCIDRFGLGPMLAIMLSSGVVHALALWLGGFFVGAFFFSIFCTGYFAYMYSALAFEFGFEYYGLLAGVVQSVGSVATLALQPRLAAAAAVHGWPAVQLLEACSLGLLGLALVGSKLLRARRPQEPASPATPTPRNGPAAVTSPGSSPTGLQRSYSLGDVHAQLGGTPCRRRPNLFPAADDILLIDGAHARHSVEAYQVDEPRVDGMPSKP